MKKIMILVFVIAVCGASLLAQQAGSAAPNPSGFEEPTQPVPDTGLQKIYSNLSSSPAYDANQWWDVLGVANSLALPSQSVAMPFKPKSNSHVSQVQAALKWKSGFNQVNLSLWDDVSGLPGKLLAGPVTVKNLPLEGTCCGVAKANFTGVAVTAGTQYWVVVDPGSTDFTGAWDWVITKNLVAFDVGGAVASQQVATQTPAGAVYGTIP